MDKSIIINNFSRYAAAYDQYADVQRLAALRLAKQIKENGFRDILELGCGTGNYTLLLKHKFNKARLRAVDISEKMLKIAEDKIKGENVEFILGDAEDIKLKEEFDLVTSNACFQWFNDLDKALAGYKPLLRREGIISFSIFGPGTFRELRESLAVVFKEASITASGFADKEKVEVSLKRNFSQVEIKRTLHRETLPRVKDLLKKIKYTGTKGSGLNGRISFSPGMLDKLEEAYLNKFGKISVTYEIFFCQAKK